MSTDFYAFYVNKHLKVIKYFFFAFSLILNISHIVIPRSVIL